MSLKIIIALCDELCLQYDRGSSCQEIVETASVILENTTGIAWKNVQDVRSEMYRKEEMSKLKEVDYFSTLETCGVRMYHVLRKVYSQTPALTFDLIKLRLLAVRCLDVGFNQGGKRLQNCSTASGSDREALLQRLQKSGIEVLRAYVRTIFKLNEFLDSTEAKECAAVTKELSGRDLMEEALCWGEASIGYLEAVQVVHANWGVMNRTGDSYARDFFVAAKLLTSIEAEKSSDLTIALKEKEKEKEEAKKGSSDLESQLLVLVKRVLERWSNAPTVLECTPPSLQCDAVAALRGFAVTLCSVEAERVVEANLEIFRIMAKIYSMLRQNNQLTCVKEFQKEVDDLVLVSQCYVGLQKLENATETISSVVKLTASELFAAGGNPSETGTLAAGSCNRFSLFKIELVKYHIQLSKLQQRGVASASSASSEEDQTEDQGRSPENWEEMREECVTYFLGAVAFARKELCTAVERSSAYKLLVSCCKEHLTACNFTEQAFNDTFLGLDELFGDQESHQIIGEPEAEHALTSLSSKKPQLGTKDYLLCEGEMEVLRHIQAHCRIKDNNIWGILLQRIRRRARILGTQDFLCLLSILWDRVRAKLQHSSWLEAKVCLEYLVDIIHGKQAVDLESQTVCFVKMILVRSLIGLGFIVGRRTGGPSWDVAKKKKQLSKALVYLHSSQEVIHSMTTTTEEVKRDHLIQVSVCLTFGLSISLEVCDACGENGEVTADALNALTIYADQLLQTHPPQLLVRSLSQYVHDENVDIQLPTLLALMRHLQKKFIPTCSFSIQSRNDLQEGRQYSHSCIGSYLDFSKLLTDVRIRSQGFSPEDIIVGNSRTTSTKAASSVLDIFKEETEVDDVLANRVVSFIELAIHLSGDLRAVSNLVITTILSQYPVSAEMRKASADYSNSLMWVASCAWNAASLVSSLNSNYEVDFQEIKKMLRDTSGPTWGSIDELFLSLLGSCCKLLLARQVVGCECYDDILADSVDNAFESEKQLEMPKSLSISNCFRVYFKTGLKHCLCELIEGHCLSSETLLVEDVDFMTEKLSGLDVMRVAYEKYSCPSCCADFGSQELTAVLRGLQLLSVLLKATKEEAGVHKFDTLSLAKTLTDLPSQQTLDLAILCQAFGAGLAAHELYNLSFQKECAKARPNLKRCASLTTCLLQNCSEAEKVLTYATQFLELVKGYLTEPVNSHETQNAEETPCSPDQIEFLGAFVWNRGVAIATDSTSPISTKLLELGLQYMKLLEDTFPTISSKFDQLFTAYTKWSKKES